MKAKSRSLPPSQEKSGGRGKVFKRDKLEHRLKFSNESGEKVRPTAGKQGGNKKQEGQKWWSGSGVKRNARERQ